MPELPFCPNGCGLRLKSNEVGSPVISACCSLCDCRFELYLMTPLDDRYITEKELDKAIDAMCKT